MATEDSQFSKNEVSGVFDRMASYYADERGQSPWFQAQLKIVLEMLDSERGLFSTSAAPRVPSLSRC